MNTIKQGFYPDKPKEKDFIFGSGQLSAKELQSDGDWSGFLPEVEIQKLHSVEPYGCVSFTILNALEILIKRIYGIDKNYSDRFLAAISGTKERRGNTPRNVADCLLDRGVVLQEVWPFTSDISSYEKFYGEIPQEVLDLAEEFNKEWEFGYDRVPSTPEAISAAIKCSPLLISVYAWKKNKDGIYYKPDGYSDIHATTMIGEREGVYRRLFDTYEPHIKNYDWNSMPVQVMRFWIKKRTEEPVITGKGWLVDLITNFYKFLIDSIIKLVK